LAKDYILSNIDEDFHREFKAACSHYGLSMRVVFIRHMENIVNDYRKYKKGFTGNNTTKLKKRKK